jgi:hypothetical protein
LKLLSWVNFTLGLWLIIAAFTLPGTTGPGTAAEGVAGIIVAVLAYTSGVERPRPAVSWSVAVAGLWILIISYGPVTPSKVNAMLVGALVVVVGTANAMYWHLPTHDARKHSFR